MSKHRMHTALAACVAAAVLVTVGTGVAGAQPVFDNMKCYKIKDGGKPKQFTEDLDPKLTHDFASQLGDRIVGGFLQKGCRIKTPAKFFCIDVAAVAVHDVVPPYTPAQWVVPGAEAGERLCYALSCPAELPKNLDIIDPFGTRTIQLRGSSQYFCTPVARQQDVSEPCSLAGNGQCGGTCPDGNTCLAISTQDCGCVPPAEACAASQTCGSGFCGGVWETCVTIGGGCGCSHPPS